MQPIGHSLAPFLFLVGIVIVLVSSRKLKTLGRMLLAFIVTTVVLLLLGALLRTGEPEMFGILTAQIAIGVSDTLGVFHVLSLRRARKGGASG